MKRIASARWKELGKRSLLVLSLAVCAVELDLAAQDANADSLAEQFASEGWEMASGHFVSLPASDLATTDALAADVWERMAGRQGWKRFAAESRLAPVSVAIDAQEVAGTRVGHLVTTRFVLRAPLAAFSDDDQAAQSLGLDVDSPGSMFRPLTAEECTAAGVEPAADGSEQYALVELTLLNRVVVRGVIRVQRQRTDRGWVLAWAFDHRFDAEQNLKVTASKRASNELGERVAESAVAYAGAAGVVVVRELSADERTAAGHATDEPPVVIVESRLAVAEPQDWFAGSNLLRSKIPLITQEGVRDLRRRLESRPTDR